MHPLGNVIIKTLKQRGINKDQIAVMFVETTWMGNILKYLKIGVILIDPIEAWKVQRQPAWYYVIDDIHFAQWALDILGPFSFASS